jgi:hypothetical protein
MLRIKVFWGGYAVTIGKQVLTFRKNIMPSPSGLRYEGITISPNVCNTCQSRRRNIKKAEIFRADSHDEANSRVRKSANATKNGYYIFRYKIITWISYY